MVAVTESGGDGGGTSSGEGGGRGGQRGCAEKMNTSFGGILIFLFFSFLFFLFYFFLYIKKVPREVLWWTFMKKRVPIKYIGIIKNMYNGVLANVRTCGGITCNFFLSQ